MKLPPGNPMYSWPELFARLALSTKPSVAVESSGRVTLMLSQADSARIIEELDRLTKEDA